MKIGLLATYDGILAGRYAAALLDHGVRIDCVLLDRQPTEQRDIALHEERTCGHLPPIPWHKIASARIPLFAVPSHNDPLLHALARERDLGLLVNAGTPRILSEATLKCTPLGVINCHPGLLPAYRGSSCVEWALLSDADVGNSVHLMTTGVDEGPVLANEVVPVVAGSSYSQIRISVYEAGFVLLARACRDLQRGEIDRRDFKAQGAGRRHKPIDAQSMNIVLSRYPEPA